MNNSNYSYWNVSNSDFDTTLDKVKLELANVGFGIITEINMQNTLKNKLNVDIRPYVILGACHPPSAYKVLLEEEQIGLMLPCNVIVYVNELQETIVAAINPLEVMKSTSNERLNDVALEIDEKIKKVITQFG